jgi:hypothetical protein
MIQIKTDGLLQQSFLQTDAQVARDDLHEKLGFGRRAALKCLDQYR